MYEKEKVVGDMILLRAVTYLRTALIGWQQKFASIEDAEKAIEELEIHDHGQGIILEVGRLE